MLQLNKYFSKNMLGKIQKIDANKYLEMFPQLKEEKTKKFTTLVLTILALSLFFILAINPTLSTIAKLNKELEDSRFVDQQLQTKINNLSVLQTKYTNLQGDLPFVYESLPQKSEIPLLIAQIQALIKESNMNPNSLQTFQVEVVSPKLGNKKFTSFSFFFSTSGTYSDINKLVSSLTKMQRIVTFDTISLTKKSTADTIMQLSVRGNAYFKE